MYAITEWTTKLAQIRERVLNDRITSLEDPRAQQIIASDHYPMDDGGQVLAQYFDGEDPVLEQIIFMHFTEKPPCPIPLPSWADTRIIRFGEWPEITIEHQRTVTAGDFTVQVDAYISVFTELTEWLDGEVFQAGHILGDSDDPRLVITHGGGDSKDFIISDLQELDILGEALLNLSLRITESEA